MKKFVKILSLALALIIMASMLIGCGGESTVNTGGKFTYWVSMPSSSSQTLMSFNDMLMYQEISKATGTQVEFIHPASGTTGTEAFQIILASGDYPDMMEYTWGDYTGGPDQAIADGVIISLNEYMKDYAPNYYDIMEGKTGKEADFRYKADSMSSQGNYYGFKGLNIGTYGGYGGLYVRKDMLDKWGLDIPVTIDDWTNLLKTAKENGIKAPFTGNRGTLAVFASPSFNTGWNVGKNYYLVNEKVKFGPFEPEYTEYLSTMREWMKLGYIDKDIVTNSNTEVEGFMTNGSSVASFGYVGGTLGKLIPAMLEKDPGYKLAACPYPVMNKGDKAWFQEVADYASDPCIAISTQCGIDNEDRYKEAIKWCDYIYSEEGTLLKAFGIEGNTYKVEKDEDGTTHYVYTDAITNPEAIGAHDISAALYHFMRPANAPGYNQHPDYLKGYYPYDAQKEAIEVWNVSLETAREHTLPGSLSFTEDEAVTSANVEFEAKNNLEAAVSNYVLGKISLDEYNKEIQKCKKAGYDKLIKIQQAAYDRYIAATNKN